MCQNLRKEIYDIYIYIHTHTVFCLSTHSLMDIHCLAIMNNAAINTGVQRSESPLLILLRIFPEGEVLNHMVIYTFTFLRDHRPIFTAAALFYEPTRSV